MVVDIGTSMVNKSSKAGDSYYDPQCSAGGGVSVNTNNAVWGGGGVSKREHPQC